MYGQRATYYAALVHYAYLHRAHIAMPETASLDEHNLFIAFTQSCTYGDTARASNFVTISDRHPQWCCACFMASTRLDVLYVQPGPPLDNVIISHFQYALNLKTVEHFRLYRPLFLSKCFTIAKSDSLSPYCYLFAR